MSEETQDDWGSPFIVYRVTNDGCLEEVFYAPDLKKAKYWLTYIAQPGDVLCRTPAHPRHEDSKPKYWSHKAKSGSTSSDSDNWEQFAKDHNWKEEWPTKQYGA